MVKEHLSFRIELIHPKDEFESDSFARDFVRSLGLKTYSGTWSGINLESPLITDFIERSKGLVNNNIARFDGYCTLSQRLEDRDNNKWYELKATKPFSAEDYSEIITCKADKMPPNTHIAYGFLYNIFFSERFVNVVKENHLSGIDFLWVKDIGRFQASQWFLPVVINALGRGIDHPWFDVATLKGSSSNQPFEPEFRCGICNFRASQIKKNHVFENPLHSNIISLFNPEILSIISYKRFLQSYTPNTDFAFIWHSTDFERKRGDYGIFYQDNDMVCKQRGLCISKRAKDILIANKLITYSNLEPIEILENVPDNIAVLDNKAPLPTPFYSCGDIELPELKKKLEIDWINYNSKPKPVKKITFKQALKYLAEEKRSRPDDFCKALNKNEISISKIELPEYWIEVLKKSNGCFLNDECTLIPLREIQQFSQDKQKYMEKVDEEFIQNLVHVASSVDGDWYSLMITSEEHIDSKVMRISHETCQPSQEWDTIAMFIYDMLLESNS